MRQLSNGKMHFLTTQEAGNFPTFFDNLRWILAEKNLQEDTQNGRDFYIEAKNSPLENTVNFLHVPFTSADLYTPLGDR
jgi:hypothetical protein